MFFYFLVTSSYILCTENSHVYSKLDWYVSCSTFFNIKNSFLKICQRNNWLWVSLVSLYKYVCSVALPGGASISCSFCTTLLFTLMFTVYMSSFFLILTSLSGWLTFSFSGKEHREILCLQMTDSYMNRVLIILRVHFICPDSEISTTEYSSVQQFIESYWFILKTNHSMFSITEFCCLTYLICFLHYDFSYV